MDHVMREMVSDEEDRIQSDWGIIIGRDVIATESNAL